MNFIFKSIVVCILILIGANEVSAQGVLKKLKKSSDKVEATDSSNGEDADTADVKLLNWKKVPKYHPEKRVVTSEDGTPLKNEDGSTMVCVLLVDQFGQVRSAEAVKEQHKMLNKRVTKILLKVGGGAAAGAVGGLVVGKGKAGGALIGGAAGAAAGILASKDDIREAKELKKTLKEQEAMLESYQMSFTNEGTPVDASIDVAKIEGLEISEGVSMTAEAYKKICASESFSSFDERDWDLDQN